MSERNQEQAEDFRIAIKQRDAALADAAALRERVEQLEALFQQTHGVHHSWVAKGMKDEATIGRLRERVTRAEALLLRMTDALTVRVLRTESLFSAGSDRSLILVARAFLDPTEPDGASETKEKR